jgi:hypothetical protein
MQHAAPAIPACCVPQKIKGHLPFAYIWPPNGQTAESRAKSSPPSRPPRNLSPDKKFPWPNEILPGVMGYKKLYVISTRAYWRVPSVPSPRSTEPLSPRLGMWKVGRSESTETRPLASGRSAAHMRITGTPPPVSTPAAASFLPAHLPAPRCVCP